LEAVVAIKSQCDQLLLSPKIARLKSKLTVSQNLGISGGLFVSSEWAGQERGKAFKFLAK